MKNKLILVSFLLMTTVVAVAQDEEEEREEKKGFKKENLFTGGTISVGFSNNSFLVGGNPMFGYSVADWLDAGIVINYTYSSYRDVLYLNDRLHQSVYGPGAFIKLYPARFLFATGQIEHNFLRQKYIPNDGGPNEKAKNDVTSYLVGAGYTSGREPGSGQAFFYLSILFDLSDDVLSPYKDSQGRSIPLIRGGVQIPLFQNRIER